MKKHPYSLRKCFFFARILLFYLKYRSFMRLTYVAFAALAPSKYFKSFWSFSNKHIFKKLLRKKLMAHGAEILCREGQGWLLIPMKTAIQSHLSKNHMGLVSLLLEKHRCWGWKLIYWFCLSPSGMELSQCPEDCCFLFCSFILPFSTSTQCENEGHLPCFCNAEIHWCSCFQREQEEAKI